MSPEVVGVGLAVFAALMTASAHFVWKSAGDRLVIRALISGSAAVLVLPALVWVGWPERAIWPWLALSGLTHIPYQLAVMRAYDRLDFSLAFPIARGVAPLASGLLAVILLGDRLNALGVLGLVAVSAGLALLTLTRGVPKAGILAAVTAGLLTTTYTLVDAAGVRAASEAFEFIVWLFIVEAALIIALTFVVRGGATLALAQGLWKEGIAGGIFSLLGYGAILLAFRHIPVGPASALRETSVLFAALLGAVLLKERVGLGRAFAIAFGLLGAGLIVLGTLS